MVIQILIETLINFLIGPILGILVAINPIVGLTFALPPMFAPTMWQVFKIVAYFIPSRRVALCLSALSAVRRFYGIFTAIGFALILRTARPSQRPTFFL